MRPQGRENRELGIYWCEVGRNVGRCIVVTRGGCGWKRGTISKKEEKRVASGGWAVS